MKTLLVILLLLSWQLTSALDDITLQLKWFHQFQFAGYYAAIEQGFYAEEGLNVTLRERDPRYDPVQEVLMGRAQYGITDTGLVLAAQRGKPVVLVAQIFQHSPLILMTRKSSGLKTPYDLIGKRVTTDATGLTDTPILALLNNTLGSLQQVELQPYSFRYEDLLEHKTDALAGYLTDQPFYFRQQGESINIIDPRDYGIDFYGDNLFTTRAEINAHPQRVEAMRRATLKGWQYALQYPEAMIDLILQKYNSSAWQNRAHLAYQAREIAKMIMPEFIEIGRYQASRYRKIAEIYAQLGLSNDIHIPTGFFLESYFSQLKLTPSEQAWLAQHPRIEVGVMAAWPPFNFVGLNGQPQGIGVDILRALNRRLDGVLQIQSGAWPTLYQAVKHQRLPALLDITPKPERQDDFLFTQPYLSIPHVLVTRKDNPVIHTEADLAEHRLALEQGFGNVDYFAAHYPCVDIQQYANTALALDAVMRGEADAYVGNRAVVTYVMAQEVMLNLQVRDRLHKSASMLAIGVRKDWPILRDILQKALDDVSETEKHSILQAWNLRQPTDTQVFNALSLAEKQWLAEQPVVRARVSHWPPYMITTPEPSGMAVDYLDLMAQRFGFQVKYVVDEIGWEASQQDMTSGRYQYYDLILTMNHTPERDPLYAFSNNYLSAPWVIYTRRNSPLILNLDSLQNKLVAAETAYAMTARLKANYPHIRLLEVPHSLDALRAVATGRADAYVGNLVNASYFIKQHNLPNLVVAAPTPFGEHHNAMAVRRDWPELASLLNKGLASISAKQRHAINQKWGAIETRPHINYRLAWQIGSVAIVIIVLVLWRNHSIRQQKNVLANSEIQLRHSHESIAQLNAELQKNVMILNEGQQLASIGGWSFDVATQTIWWTDELFALHGLPICRNESDFQEKAAQSINCYPADQREPVMAAFENAVNQAQAYDLEHLFTRYDGQQLWVRNVGKPMLEQGKVVRVIGTLMDISKHKKIQQELETARDEAQAANRAKSLFLANMSHELRTPLNAILGFSQLLTSDTSISPPQRNKLDTINRAGEHLLTMINDVLDLSKIEAGKTELHEENFDLVQMLQDIAEMFSFRAADQDLAFHLQLAMPPTCPVNADHGKLRQILFNLLSNAIKFTQQGHISLRATCQPVSVRQQQPSCGLKKTPSSSKLTYPCAYDVHYLASENATVAAGHYCYFLSAHGLSDTADSIFRVEIEDTGIGIQAAALETIFHPFNQAMTEHANQGTGLGLSISRSFIELMHGLIGACSTPQQGSIFYFEVPLKTASEAPLNKQNRLHVIGLQDKTQIWRILVVDDDADNRALLRNLLQPIGFAVQEAENGAQAIELFSRWQPHFIWLDIRMPVLDGYATAQRIRALPNGDTVSIVAVTASVFLAQEDEVLKAGCDAILRKPYHPQQVFALLEKYLPIRYVYKHTATRTEAPTRKLQAEDLAQLPDTQLNALLDAVVGLKAAEVKAIVDQLEPRQPLLAQAINALIAKYRYEYLMDLCQQALALKNNA